MAKSQGRYPYKIPEVRCPDSETLRRLPPALIAAFLRIEALLRSENIFREYRRTKKPWPTQADNLRGAHHRLLEERIGGKIVKVIDPDSESRRLKFESLLDPPMPPSPYHLVIRINLLAQKTAIMKDIQAMLREKAAHFQGRRFDLQTWLNYFRCYDLRVRDKLTFGQIGKIVYPEEKASKAYYERAEQGYKRAARMIKAAETNSWPPAIR